MLVKIFGTLWPWFCGRLTAGAAGTLVVTDFGVVNDGKTVNTKAIQAAIDKAAETPGTTLVFPKGDYLTGSLILKSDITLQLEKGAVLLGSTNPADYLKMETGAYSPKQDDNSSLGLLLANGAKNLRITGKGTIDAQGRELALTTDRLHRDGSRIDPHYDNERLRPNETARPKLLRLVNCDNTTISGISIRNGACWVVSCELCTNLTLDGLKIESRAYWNNDGIDITDCRNVKITHCDVNSADDGICLKSYHPGQRNEQVLISDCVVRSSASAIKFGTASLGGFKAVTVKNIKVRDTFRSAVAIECVDGGVLEDVEISDIDAVNTGNAIFIRLGRRAGENPGILRNVTIRNLKAQIPFDRPDIDYDMRGPEVNFFHNPFPSSITGILGSRVENVTLENISISCPGRASKGVAYIPSDRLAWVPENAKLYPEFSMFGELPAWGFYVRHVKGLKMKNVRLSLDKDDFRPALVFDDVEGLSMEAVSLPPGKTGLIVKHDCRM